MALTGLTYKIMNNFLPLLFCLFFCVSNAQEYSDRLHFSPTTCCNVNSFRSEIIDSLFFETGNLPQNTYDSIEKDMFPNDDVNPQVDFKQINRMEFTVADDVSNTVYHIEPSNRINKTFIVSIGHDDQYTDGNVGIMVDSLLLRGFDVLLAYMPCYSETSICPTDIGNTQDHDLRMFESTLGAGTLRLFFEHIIRSINYIKAEVGTSSVYATGWSGGAWMITWVAALDLRVTKTFAISGTYPMYIRDLYGGNGEDYEQGFNITGLNGSTPLIDNFYRDVVGYEDLYTLASVGFSKDREYHQIHSTGDPCCFNYGALASFGPLQENVTNSITGSNYEWILFNYNYHGFTVNENIPYILSRI